MTFWLRRWIEQSRTPRAHAVPWPSAISWTSTCRAPVTRRSRKTVPLPNARSASSLVRWKASVEVLGGGHHPDAAAATARGRLEHQRVADLVGAGQRALEGVDRAAAPRSDRDAHLLGEQLRADLVAQPAHRLGARTDEGDAQAVAQVDERGVLGHEAPARPHRVGTALRQGTFEDGQVDVGPCRCRPEVVGQRRPRARTWRAASPVVCRATVSMTVPGHRPR